MILLANRHLVSLREQWPKLAYRRPGALRDNHHIVDHYAVIGNVRYAFAVKATEFLVESKIMDIRDLLIEQNDGKFFDEFIVVTDEQITPARSDNAEEIVIACDNRNERHCALVMDFMRTIHRPIHFLEVERTLPPDIDVRNSLLCLVYDGLVEHLSPDEHFDDAPFLRTAFN
jgi:hypothetical protein